MPDLHRITAIPTAPARPADAHKGTFGTVIVVGGSEAMIGAPAMTARAAFRAGAGLVKIAAAPEVLRHAIVIEPSATGIVLQGDARTRLETIGQGDAAGRAVLAVGPGLGQSIEARELVLALLKGERSVVLDADGLNALAASAERASTCAGRDAALVLTPHPGEFRRLATPLNITHDPTDPDQRPQAAAALAQAHHAVVVLKGRRTVVTDGERLFVNDTGDAALAVGGTGDVLTGVIAGLIAQGMTPFDAAVLGVHVHGKAGDQWSAAHGPRGLLARDLADFIPDLLRD